MISLSRLILLGAAVINFCFASQPKIEALDFADPSIILDPKTSHLFAFALKGNGKNVQALTGIDGQWLPLPDVDILPVPGMWVNATHPNIRAPDVHYIQQTDTYILYYTALHTDSPYYCVGIATASKVTGPFTAFHHPFACPLEDGGAIDASGFYDEEFRSRWVVYKVDGNSKGLGGPCGNGDTPGFETPIVMQRVSSADGITPFGKPIPILLRDPDIDGEFAVYVLFYSSHCRSQPEYDVRYATAKHVLGPYTRQSQLIGAANASKNNFTAPGGATAVMDVWGTMVFHANCGAGRCMHQADFAVDGGKVKLQG
ncbi:glycosyl hydrolase [Podospora aff. communis PSN243]|uniref:Glycosyl hydrolase n=1 Tax=Podospora aff. communis PSN243 TaxID=3040156 RepID=A0AAV9G3W3_9PEZI|nr:glycosyl hydrolase [Podospora aff. communis PSN243]